MSIEKDGPRSFLPPDAAFRAAEDAIKLNGMREWPQCSLLKHPDLVHNEPILVQGGDDRDEPVHIYIIPYGLRGEHTASGVPFTRLCIVVDAVSGNFDEVCTFGKPFAYLPEANAIRVVASALQVPEGSLHAEWMFVPCEISQSRTVPFWRVVHDDSTLYVDNNEKLYNGLFPSKGGS